MSLFGFDAMLDWEGAESTLLLSFGVCVFGPLLLVLIANILIPILVWPRGKKMR